MSETETKKELDLDAKVTVRSIAGWSTGFSRRADGAIGDINIVQRGTARLSRNEIIAQVQDGNKLFLGLDDKGSHATLIIEDEPTRIELGFDAEDGSYKQVVFSNELVKNLFKITNQNTFENRLREAICTRAEKYAVIEAIKELKLNDYSKIRFIEKYTGNRVQ